MAFPTQQILHRITEGDKVAFAQLCTHFREPALTLCRVILKDDGEAEAITSHVFEKIWEDRIKLEKEENFQSYLFLNLRNQIFMEMRKYQDLGFRQTYLDKMGSVNRS
ncbi:RNA polymerase sigma factor [Dyadobacter crusticola]|uniref:RNA polymerase sigma factor n=1 Tax=Dyadobacter crusticola TaxID=292407 RepID=UPI0004E1744C|nr:ECF subfamily RNA polymerase sigma-24 subunit [Dyadobacter crusticola]